MREGLGLALHSAIFLQATLEVAQKSQTSASCGYKPSAKATNKVLGNDTLTRSVGREHFHKPSCARARSENTVRARVLFLPMTLLGRPAKEIEIATRQFKHFGYEGLMRCFCSAFSFWSGLASEGLCNPASWSKPKNVGN